MKLDKDILEMSHAERGQELMRVRKLIRTHKAKRNNARCWLADLMLYAKTLPEKNTGAGSMDLPIQVLLKNCRQYIVGQQCSLKKPSKQKKRT